MFDSNRYSTEELLGRMADLVDLLRRLRKLGYTEEALRVGREFAFLCGAVMGRFQAEQDGKGAE